MKLNNIIYGLRDSRNDLYYYIGKSSVGESRPKQHLLKSHSDKVNKWVQEVEGTGNVVYIDILETIEYKEGLKKAEKYWINYYLEVNPFLLNTQIPKLDVQGVGYNIIGDKDVLENLISVTEDIAVYLKKFRKSKKLSQTEMAEKYDICLGTLKRLEKNKYTVGTHVLLRYLKSIYNTL